MKRKILSILLVVALLLVAIPVATVFASDGYNLIATEGGPGTGTEDRITVDLPAGTTLGQLQSISWQEWLVAGYPPHVDIILEDDALVVEYAYNGHESDPQITGDTAYGAVSGDWFPTFNDDGKGIAEVSDSARAWLNSGPSGGTDIIIGTLEDWKDGDVDSSVDSNSVVLRLEIEVDNWIIDTTAKIKDIVVDFGGASSTLTGTVADPPTVVSVTLDLATVDFGTLYRGATSDIKPICITNGGNVSISVVASVNVGADSPFNYLTVTPSNFSVPVGGSQNIELVVNVPADFPVGSYIDAGALVFTATAE